MSSNDIAKQWSMDLLLLIASYSGRPDQINLIRVVFHTKNYQDLIPSLSRLSINPLTPNDIIFIKHCNLNVMMNNGHYFYFNDIRIGGLEVNIEKLQSNANGEILSFLFLLHFGNKYGAKMRNNSIERVNAADADKLHLTKRMRFKEKVLYNANGKTTLFQFHRFQRSNKSKSQKVSSWKAVNQQYLRDLIGVMMNHCDDIEEFVDYKDEIAVEGTGDALHILSGCDLYAECTTYSMMVTETKHIENELSGDDVYRLTAVVKTCYMVFFEPEFTRCGLLKMVNGLW